MHASCGAARSFLICLRAYALQAISHIPQYMTLADQAHAKRLSKLEKSSIFAGWEIKTFFLIMTCFQQKHPWQA